MKFLIALLFCLPLFTQAQSWRPDKAVELVVGAAPGGANDRIGRSLQRLLQNAKVGTVNVLNKPGGGQSVRQPLQPPPTRQSCSTRRR